MDEAVQAITQGNIDKASALQREALLDTRFKDNELLYTIALCEKMQKEYDGYDSNSNIEAQRYPIPGELEFLGRKISSLSDEEKSLIPEAVWNRLGDVVINETLDDYYDFPDYNGIIDRNIMRLNNGAMKLLPNVAKYGSYKDHHLLKATLFVAEDMNMRANCDEDCFGKVYESQLNAAQLYRKKAKAFRKPDRKKQDIKKRSEYLKNKKRKYLELLLQIKLPRRKSAV